MPFKGKDTTFMARSLPKLLIFVQKNSQFNENRKIVKPAAKCGGYAANMQL
jgi:hypothetical protein